MWFLKLIGWIIGISVAVNIFMTCTKGCSKSEKKTTPKVYTDNREELIGVWRGTSSSNQGFGGKEIALYKNGDNYRAHISMFPAQGSPRGYNTSRWIADASFNQQTGMVELKQMEIITDTGSFGSFAIRRGSLVKGEFVGEIEGHNGSSFNLANVDKSNYNLAYNHIHIPSKETRDIRAATCAREGIKAIICKFCNQETSRENVAMIEHTPSGNWRVINAATCTAEGIRIQNCRVCNTEVARESVPIIAHTPRANWEVLEESTCTEEGIRIQNCRICNQEANRDSIPIIDHSASVEWIVITEPLCNVNGLHIQYCIVCNAEAISEEIPAITGEDHVFDKHVIFGNIVIPPIVREDVCTICNFIGAKHYDFSFIWVTIIILICIGIGIYLLVMFIKNLLSFVCPYCFNKFYKKDVRSNQCPGCRGHIPDTVLRTSILPFCIIGVSGSGKTNYITVMLHEMERAMGLPLILSPQNSYTKDNQNENFSRIYEKHIPPESTAAGAELKPQIWCVTNDARKAGNKVLKYTFTIYDGAGEDQENIQSSDSNVCRYIKFSEAIIIALDPLILVNVRRDGIVDKDEMKNSLSGREDEYKNGTQVVEAVASYIKQAQGIKENVKLKIPVAVVLTKFDTILSHESIDEGALIKKSSSIIRDGAFVKEEMEQIDKEIREWLEKIGEASFVRSIEANFKKSYFFGVSSLGKPPKSGEVLNDQIKPHRVLDPILWLFKLKRFID